MKHCGNCEYVDETCDSCLDGSGYKKMKKRYIKQDKPQIKLTEEKAYILLDSTTMREIEKMLSDKQPPIQTTDTLHNQFLDEQCKRCGLNDYCYTSSPRCNKYILWLENIILNYTKELKGE